MTRGVAARVGLLSCGLFAVTAFAQNQPGPIPSTEVKLRKAIYKNPRLTAYLLEIPPRYATVLHRHDTDMLSVFISGGSTKAIFNGQAAKTDTFAAGDVRFRSAGFTHSTENIGVESFRAVVIEFATAQGQANKSADPPMRSCAGASKTACLDTKSLFCTAKFCADDITLAPGAAVDKPQGSAWILVAVSDYNLADVDRSNMTARSGRSGQVEDLGADAKLSFKNASTTPARFIAVVFR